MKSTLHLAVGSCLLPAALACFSALYPSSRSAGVVRIRVGDAIQPRVDSAPPGTRFTIAQGVHVAQSVRPKSGDVFIGEPGAVLDGEDHVVYAFRNDTVPFASNVELRGLVIEHYAPPPSYGAIRADFLHSGGWEVTNCEIRFNSTGGIRTGPRMHVTRNYIHHNGQAGILGSGDSLLVAGNEIAENNYLHAFNFHHEAGGAKFTRTRGAVIRDNYSHDNYGPGLWTDIDNIDVLYEHNRVENNAEAGIFHEIGYAARIRENTARGNGTAVEWVAGAGILLNTSQNVEIDGNHVVDNRNGIVVIDDERGMGRYGPYHAGHITVHDNDVEMNRGVTGVVAGATRPPTAHVAQDIRFYRNTYRLTGADHQFRWNGQSLTLEQWRGYGHDRP